MELFYRHWIDDNISKKGITRDLEAMAKAGIDETFTGNVTDTRLNFVSPGRYVTLGGSARSMLFGRPSDRVPKSGCSTVPAGARRTALG